MEGMLIVGSICATIVSMMLFHPSNPIIDGTTPKFPRRYYNQILCSDCKVNFGYQQKEYFHGFELGECRKKKWICNQCNS